MDEPQQWQQHLWSPPKIAHKPFRQFVNNLYYEWCDECWEYTKQAPTMTQEQYYLSNKKFLKDTYKDLRG